MYRVGYSPLLSSIFYHLNISATNYFTTSDLRQTVYACHCRTVQQQREKRLEIEMISYILQINRGVTEQLLPFLSDL